MSGLVYFSSVSENTKRFIDKLSEPAHRIPLRRSDEPLVMDEEYVLVTPTYGAGKDGGAVPKQVIRFLNDERNRQLIRGVIGGGNTNFGAGYCLAADIISLKCNIPVIYRFEVFGTPEDVADVTTRLDQFWNHS